MGGFRGSIDFVPIDFDSTFRIESRAWSINSKSQNIVDSWCHRNVNFASSNEPDDNTIRVLHYHQFFVCSSVFGSILCIIKSGHKIVDEMKHLRLFFIASLIILGIFVIALLMLHSQSTKDELTCDVLTVEISHCDSLIVGLEEKRGNVSSPSMMGDVEAEMLDVLQRKDSLVMLKCSASGDDEDRRLVEVEYETWKQLKDVLIEFVTTSIETKYWDDSWKYVYGWYFEEDVLNLHLDHYSQTSKQTKVDENIIEQKSQILELCNSILDSIKDISDDTDDPVSMQYTGHIKYNKECAFKSIKLLPNAIDNWVEANISMRGEDSTTSFLCRLYEIIKEDTK